MKTIGIADTMFASPDMLSGVEHTSILSAGQDINILGGPL